MSEEDFVDRLIKELNQKYFADRGEKVVFCTTVCSTDPDDIDNQTIKIINTDKMQVIASICDLPKPSPTVTVPREEWERMKADAAKWRRIEPDAIAFEERMKSVTEIPPGLRKIIEAIRGVVESSEHRTVRIYCQQAGDYWYAHFDELGCIGHGDTIFEALRHLVQVAADYHYAYQGIPEKSLVGTVLDRRNASNRFFNEWVNPNSLTPSNAVEEGSK